MNKLLPRKDFLAKYNFTENEFELTTLKWSDLELIYEDFVPQIPNYEALASYVLNKLIKVEDVHSVRYRVKDPEHLIAKIIRKRKEDQTRVITIDNYREEITDLVGFRILHLFKEKFTTIHEAILSTWDTKERPIIYYRKGDIIHTSNELFVTIEHPKGYRSIHYIIKSSPTKESYYAEIQLRTIFEEAWSEIDHTVRYPVDLHNPLLEQSLLILSRYVGSADEMGSYIKMLADESQNSENSENLHKQELAKKDEYISELERELSALSNADNLRKMDTRDIRNSISKIKKLDIVLSKEMLESIKIRKELKFMNPVDWDKLTEQIDYNIKHLTKNNEAGSSI